ncbi:39S ribosomal protein L18, mitochondrial-like [Homalodisca vitripennis]|uniref:39S ribosomal protein L18, mitochondrial-like n=1 Tax=Homalodisca vitripennis TaxID=197043 RepID=UPI001EEA228D|nr:39S ribosomal protein L18, mitochondrial-like [Homalodisca vitripennis]XP_046689087.1 39S ribosomal protein L18, mitochondrial-like [Homalodisca vitripennis]XP_046689088.1 39S ribosomal protein L18, mitochondrial-like [Homalodisca vitripennis]
MFSPLRSAVRQERCRFASSVAKDTAATFYYNRNPRNLEKLRIALKPQGFHLDKPGKSYWNKLVLKYNRSARSVTGEVVHNSGHVAVSASTNEWALCKQLYRLVNFQSWFKTHNLFCFIEISNFMLIYIILNE